MQSNLMPCDPGHGVVAAFCLFETETKDGALHYGNARDHGL